MTTYSITDDILKVKASTEAKEYRSKPIMTKYEFNELISLRTTHLSLGAIPFVQVPEELNIVSNMQLRKIALQELKEGKLPYLVKRTIPNHKPEYWAIKNMDLTSVRNLIRE
jgi:DNA-directed RNA polymerase subunit K/omega